MQIQTRVFCGRMATLICIRTFVLIRSRSKQVYSTWQTISARCGTLSFLCSFQSVIHQLTNADRDTCGRYWLPIHHASSKQQPVSFIIGRHDQQVGLYCRFPGLLHGLIQRQFHAKYPDCTIELLEEDAVGLSRRI